MQSEAHSLEDTEDFAATEDPVIEAIDEVSRSVGKTVENERHLLNELERVKQERVSGKSLRESLGRSGRPLAIVLMHGILKQITGESARLRHVLASGLLREGESKVAIARRFEVTHQRISAILSRKPNGDSDAIASVDPN